MLTRQTAAFIVNERDWKSRATPVAAARRGTAMARLYSLAVDPDHLGKGIGALLLKGAEEETFNRKRLLLRLEVREDNESAIALYRRKGYRPIGRYLDYYADHAPALRFERPFAAACRLPHPPLL
ncbi:MAG: GNAT family N-acetyltransferase [Nitratireductor sp.]